MTISSLKSMKGETNMSSDLIPKYKMLYVKAALTV